MVLLICRELSLPSWRSHGRSLIPSEYSHSLSTTTPYHARLSHYHIHGYIKLISRHFADELHVERQARRTNMWRKVLDNPVKVSSHPTQPVARTVPEDSGNENHVNSIKARGIGKLKFRL